MDDGTVVVAADDRHRPRSDDLVLLARGQGAADAVRPLIDSAKIAFERVARETTTYRRGLGRERSAEIDRQLQQQERDNVGYDTGEYQQQSGQHSAPAIDQAAEKRLIAAQCRERLRAKSRSL